MCIVEWKQEPKIIFRNQTGVEPMILHAIHDEWNIEISKNWYHFERLIEMRFVSTIISIYCFCIWHFQLMLLLVVKWDQINILISVRIRCVMNSKCATDIVNISHFLFSTSLALRNFTWWCKSTRPKTNQKFNLTFLMSLHRHTALVLYHFDSIV